MKRRLFVLASLVLILAMAGCVRTYVATKERVDTDVSGNQGVIYGPSPAPHKVEVPTRDIYSIDVELPTMGEVKESVQKKEAEPKAVTPDKGLSGNAGMVSQGQPEKIK